MTAAEPSAALSPTGAPAVRRALEGDVDPILGVVRPFVTQRLLLPRTPAEVGAQIHSWWVAELDGEVIGCVALRDFGTGIGEVRSLSVADTAQRRGAGALLLGAAIDDAARLGIGRLFAITRNPAFFARHRFAELPMGAVPHVLGTDRVPWPRPSGSGHAMERRP